MGSSFIPWGDDAHRFVYALLPWHSNASLACCSWAFYEASAECAAADGRAWWGQAQSVSQYAEALVASLGEHAEALSPSSRPNMAIFMVDVTVLVTATVRDLCGRMHAANLVPLDCPIFVIKSDAGVFGAGVSGEGNFSTYENRDIELDPIAPVTAVLTVAYVPPEQVSGRLPKHRVRSFLVDDRSHYRRYRSMLPSDPPLPVYMESVPFSGRRGALRRRAKSRESSSSRPAAAATLSLGGTAEGGERGGGAPGTYGSEAVGEQGERVSADATALAGAALETARDPHHLGAIAIAPTLKAALDEPRRDGGDTSVKGKARPLRRSPRTSTAASSQTAMVRVGLPRLLPPLDRLPLEDADTIFLVGNHRRLLLHTNAWLKKLLPEAVILGGISGCALVIGNQVLPQDKRPTRTSSGSPTPQLVGIALRGVRAMAVSAGGYEGVGPVFRVDATAHVEGALHPPPRKILRHVTVVAEVGGGASSRVSTAMDILENEVPQDPAWGGNYVFKNDQVFLGVGSSADELLHVRASLGDEGRGGLVGRTPPLDVTRVHGNHIGLSEAIEPGQFARFMRTTPELALEDTAATYAYCERRMKREGGEVLSSIRFACSQRPDILELDQAEDGQQQQEPPGDGAMVTRVLALHQQEIVRFCRESNAPAAGVFCNGELGPLPAVACGILPRTAESKLQGFTSCSAVLCWSPLGL